MILTDIVAPKGPVVPFPTVLERVKLYDNFATPLPKLVVLKDTNILLLINLVDRNFFEENWLNFLAMKTMQVSMVPVQLVQYDLQLAPGFVYRDATYRAQAIIGDQILAWDAKLLGQLPPGDPGDDEPPAFMEEEAEYPEDDDDGEEDYHEEEEEDQP
jgi:hypothetical protein